MEITTAGIIRSVIKRAMVIFLGGVLITLATWILLTKGVVHFGILHLIGISIVLSIPLIKFKWLNLALGMVLILIGMVAETVRVEGNYLLWLGFKPHFYHSLDYFPLMPWFGVVLIGVFLGNRFYTNYERSFSLHDLHRNTMVKSINVLGKHSLLIYFLHQPIIVLLLIGTGIIEFSKGLSAF
jgi:uncharacterized membrane protein